MSFWKRKHGQKITPFEYTDDFDFCIVNVRFEDRYGQFVFPKEELIKRGIVSSDLMEGKRGLRVSPVWDIVDNKTTLKTP